MKLPRYKLRGTGPYVAKSADSRNGDLDWPAWYVAEASNDRFNILTFPDKPGAVFASREVAEAIAADANGTAPAAQEGEKDELLLTLRGLGNSLGDTAAARIEQLTRENEEVNETNASFKSVLAIANRNCERLTAERDTALSKLAEAEARAEAARSSAFEEAAKVVERALCDVSVDAELFAQIRDHLAALIRDAAPASGHTEIDWKARAEAAMTALRDGSRSLPIDRDTLGRMVREAWIRWAQTQPNPKPSWLLPYDDLSEPDKEADRQIGEAIARWTIIHDAARAALASASSTKGERDE